MATHTKIFYASVLLLSFFVVPTVFAVEDEPCESFDNVQIDNSLIAKMLEAAEEGHLYRIKSNSSMMGFCVASPIGMVSGNFQNFKGGIVLEDPSNQTMVSIDTNSLKADGLFVEKMLKGNDFFDVDSFKDILFVSTGFEWLSNHRAVLKGELSIRGVTKPVAFYVEITEVNTESGGSDVILVKATTTVQRSEFGMHSLSAMVSDRVNLCMSVQAERYKT